MYSSSFQQCKLRTCSLNWKLFLRKGGQVAKINYKTLTDSWLWILGKVDLYAQGFLFSSSRAAWTCRHVQLP